MRAAGRDIVELFGYRPNDLSEEARVAFSEQKCPFTAGRCSKTNHDKSVVYGVCTVTNGMRKGPNDEVIVCPRRLYQNQYEIFSSIATDVWGQSDLVIGGELQELRSRALALHAPVIAFGQNSGTEIAVNSNGQMSMDWVLQKYANDGRLRPETFVGVEVQSIDTTGNYRDVWLGYEQLKSGAHQRGLAIPDSGHGLNWANVHKRLIPQIIRKGNIYRQASRCSGFYFVLPEAVYQKFEQVVGRVPEYEGPGNDRLSIKTFSLAPPVGEGERRGLINVRTVHLSLVEVAQAFITNVDADAAGALNKRMMTIL